VRSSLLARVSPNKPFAPSQSLILKSIKATSANTTGSTAPNSSIAFGGKPSLTLGGTMTSRHDTHVFSPFRDAIQRGVLSGSGMLT
jgi:hypothetical protein